MPQPMTYHLKDFSGPLDLLLTLVQSAHLDIRDIFLSDITDQYLSIVRSSDTLDMEEAGAFLVTAATLVEIKSRRLLPRSQPPPPEEDPEAELIRRLEEFSRLRARLDDLRSLEAAASRLFTKLPEEILLPPAEIRLEGLSPDALAAAFRDLLSRTPAEADAPENHYAPRAFRREAHTVRACMLSVLRRLKAAGSFALTDLLSPRPTREEIVTYFLAVLELLKLGRLSAVQPSPGGEILLSRRSEP